MTDLRSRASSALFVVALLGVVAVVGSQAVFNQGPNPIPIFHESSDTGIILRVGLNSTVLQPGQRLALTVSLFNNLTVSDYIQTAENWNVAGFPISIWPGCLFSLPLDFTILRGNVSLDQIEAIGKGQAPGYSCMEGTSIDHVIFQPKSSNATLTGTYCGGACVPNQVYGPYNLVSNFTVGGYWDYPLTINDSNYLYSPYDGGVTFRYPEVGPVAAHPFDPGVYTLVVADEWGQVVLLHFTVFPTSGIETSLVIHVVNVTSGQPAAGVRVLAGPATSADDIAITPGGPTLKECVHGVPSGSSVLGNGTVVLRDGTRITYPTCRLITFVTNSTGWISIPDVSATYYFFNVGGMVSAYNVYGIVQLLQGVETRANVNWPNGNHTVTT